MSPPVPTNLNSDPKMRPPVPINSNSDPNIEGKSYALSGKIMLSAIVILLFVVILMVVLHLYARWYLHRARRRQIRRSRRRASRSNLVFYVDNSTNRALSQTAAAPRGLDPTVLKSLPVFVYKADTHPDQMDCAVCLSEFEEKESGRTLPKCNHSFHIECIDMWFHSHSTCPLCRAPVELPETPTRVVVELVGPSSSCGTCLNEEGHVAGSSGSKKPVGFLGITVEVPLRRPNSGFEDDSGSTESTPSQFRSPVGRMLSRILSRERRPATPPSCVDDVAEVDLERGEVTR